MNDLHALPAFNNKEKFSKVSREYNYCFSKMVLSFKLDLASWSRLHPCRWVNTRMSRLKSPCRRFEDMFPATFFGTLKLSYSLHRIGISKVECAVSRPWRSWGAIGDVATAMIFMLPWYKKPWMPFITTFLPISKWIFWMEQGRRRKEGDGKKRRRNWIGWRRGNRSVMIWEL